ncbi:hypothetical protein ACIRPK_07025 [Kitasatospora sp. NPDC101801]|uniref:hypothetical protein n=1 Tax=Kitasatospora sp. NPDC101801 TaxID=3364103 RepID=UPI00380C5D73
MTAHQTSETELAGQPAAGWTGVTWTLIHRDTLRSLAADSYGDFVRRSQEANRMANSFHRAARAAARRDLPLLAASNMTARQAARVLAHRLIKDHQLNHVVYRTGAQVPVRAWAEAATLAKPAVACNSGTLNRAREDGIQYLEVFDGPGCGWTSHRDLDRAGRTLRTVDEAAGKGPISHPRCRRTFGPRPDLCPDEMPVIAGGAP